MNIQWLWSVMQGYTDGLPTAEVFRIPSQATVTRWMSCANGTVHHAILRRLQRLQLLSS